MRAYKVDQGGMLWWGRVTSKGNRSLQSSVRFVRSGVEVSGQLADLCLGREATRFVLLFSVYKYFLPCSMFIKILYVFFPRNYVLYKSRGLHNTVMSLLK
jgi:hypothetical protein